MASYLITAKNEAYNGVTLGLKFWKGKTVLSEATVPKELGRDMKQILRGFYDLSERDGGYKIEPIKQDKAARIAAILAEVEPTPDPKAASVEKIGTKQPPARQRVKRK